MTKTLATLALFALSLTGAEAKTVTMTTTGIVQSGTDTTGVFGAAGADMTGQGYTAELTYDTTLGARATDPALFDSLIGGDWAGGTVPVTFARFTIGAVSLSFGTLDFGQVTNYDSRVIWGDPSGAYEYQVFAGVNSTNAATHVGTYLSLFDGGFDYGAGPFVYDIENPPAITNPAGHASGAFVYRLFDSLTNATLAEAGLVLEANSISAREAGPAPVPVPAAGFFLIGGLGALAGLRRRVPRQSGSAVCAA